MPITARRVAVRKVPGRYVMAKRRALPFEHKEGLTHRMKGLPLAVAVAGVLALGASQSAAFLADPAASAVALSECSGAANPAAIASGFARRPSFPFHDARSRRRFRIADLHPISTPARPIRPVTSLCNNAFQTHRARMLKHCGA